MLIFIFPTPTLTYPTPYHETGECARSFSLILDLPSKFIVFFLSQQLWTNNCRCFLQLDDLVYTHFWPLLGEDLTSNFALSFTTVN